MDKILGRLPLSVKLVMIGLIPLVFALSTSYHFYKEKKTNLALLGAQIDRIKQSALITRLIDQLQIERRESYSIVLNLPNGTIIPAVRQRTDSLVESLEAMGNGLADFKKYTSLNDLDRIRKGIDEKSLTIDGIIHFYSTIIFRLNTLNSVPLSTTIFLPNEYPPLVSQKLLSEMITYLGIVNTNIHNVLHTRKYVTETLFGSLGTYEIYKSYQQEFQLKAPRRVNARYDSIMNLPGSRKLAEYLETTFQKFKVDSTYSSESWRQNSIQTIGHLRHLQEELLNGVEVNMEKLYSKENRSIQNSRTLLIGLLVLTVAILYVIIRAINHSLSRLKTSAEKIALGTAVEEIPVSSKDIIGSLSGSIMKIDRNNKTLADAADKIGKGDFNVEVQPRSDSDILGNAVVRMKNDLSDFTGKLGESEARIRHILQAVPAGIYECDLNGRITEYNAAAIEIWGAMPDPQKHLWAGVSKMFSLEGHEIPRNEFPVACLVRGMDVNEQEVIIERENGTRRTILTRPTLVHDGKGNITGAIDAMVDITERNQIEKDTARLAAIVNSTLDAIISKTIDGIVTSWNPGAEKLFGYTAEEMIGNSIAKIIPPEKLHEEPEILSKIQQGIKIDHFETKRIRKDGKMIDISISLSPIIDKNGKIIGASKIARDITERVESARKINENEERLRMAISATRLGTWDMNPATNLLTLSEECRSIVGFSDEMVQLQQFLDLILPEDLDSVKTRIDQALQSKVDQQFDAVFRIKRAGDGEKRWVHSQGKVQIGENEKPKRFLGTMLDITESKRAQRALEESEQRTRFAIQAAQMGTFEWNLESNIFVASPRLNEIFGATGETSQHTDLISRIHPEDLEIRNKAVEESKQTGTLEYEVRVIWPDASVHWVKVLGKVIYSSTDQPTRMYGTVKDVTAEHNIIRELVESEERLNVAIEAAEMGTWELNYKTRDVKYSSRYLQILGFKEGDKPTHEDLLAKIHPDDMALRNRAMKQATQTGHLDYEMRIFCNGNEIRWIRAKGTFFYDSNGNPERALGTVVDITEQKNTFHVLMESEERFRIIANSAPVMIWMSGTDRFADFFNTSWLEFTGRTIEQERGDGWLENVHPDDKEYCIEIYHRSFRAKRPFYVEYRLKRKDGAYRYISDNAVPRFDGNGTFIGFISACRDIDDEKRFNQKVRESELLFKTIANVSPVGLWMTDATGNTNFVNDTWLEWTGIPTSEQYGMGWLRVVILADSEFVAKKFQQSFNARKSYNMEFRIKRRDGMVRWVLSNGSPYFDLDGNFAGYAGSVADITERKEDEIRKNEFLAVASHELKTPLTSIKAYTQLLAATYQKSGDAFLKNALGKVENQVNKMTKLVGDFLNLSKIESDKFELRTERFDLSVLSKDVSSDIQLVAPNHRIRVIDGHPVFIEGDKEKIAQVITNFLTNAIKYSPEGKEITVSVTNDENVARVAVKDEGIGIKPEEHQQIFQRFYRSKFNQNISYSGFGIGLYISAEIIQKHDGTIGVESKEGSGSTFYFSVPLAR